MKSKSFSQAPKGGGDMYFAKKTKHRSRANSDSRPPARQGIPS